MRAQKRLERLIDENGIDVGVIEPLREPVADGVLEPVVTEHGRENEAAERGLGRHRVLGLLADLGPDRIVRANLVLGRRARPGCHQPTPELGAHAMRRAACLTGVQIWCPHVNVYTGQIPYAS
jgi:hypothetical protein